MIKNPNLPQPSDIIIARHGRTSINEAVMNTEKPQRLMSPLPLKDHLKNVDIDSEKGVPQARNLGRHLLRLFPGGFAVYVRSDFKRVESTLNQALPHLPEDRIVVHEALRERDRGDVADIPKWQLEAQFPEHARLKTESPINWRPPGKSQTLHEKANELRSLLPLLGQYALDQPAAIFTSGEVEIASYVVPELGNMDDDALKHGLTEGWPALAVDNAQFAWYTRRSDPENPESPLSDTFDYMISVRGAEDEATSSGWIRIER
jgi:broad specificity phosphatase PhoE